LVWLGNLAPPFNLPPPFRILPPPFRILNGVGRINGGDNARSFGNLRRFVKCVMSSTVA
jgi:hypothetical protein